MNKVAGLEGLEKIAYNAVTGEDKEFSSKTSSDLIRKEIFDLMDGEWNKNKFNHNINLIYDIIEQTLPIASQATLGDRLNMLADFRTAELGDQIFVKVKNNKVYAVQATADGVGQVLRQKITEDGFNVPTNWVYITLYDEFTKFMNGDMDFAEMTAKINDAHEQYVGELIYDTIDGSYNDLNTENVYTGASDADEINKVVQSVKKRTGASKVMLIGTETALSNVSDVAGYSDADKDVFNGMGFYGRFRGNPMMSLPQSARAGSDGEVDTINDDQILVVPADEEIVVVAYEGDIDVDSDSRMKNNKQFELTVGRKVGAHAKITPNDMYGIIRFA
jgi:hypothetical protein